MRREKKIRLTIITRFYLMWNLKEENMLHTERVRVEAHKFFQSTHTHPSFGLKPILIAFIPCSGSMYPRE